uniref:Putative secreted protein n=1 Tax=Amblyomma cajennense TaxID=34607 RepID=A0A023FCP2_AMBCJ
MKALFLIAILITTAELANCCDHGHRDDSQCSPPPGGCPGKGKGPPQQVWLRDDDGKTCYNVSTSDCQGRGHKTLTDCFMFCVSE